jgi:hypothetical protein
MENLQLYLSLCVSCLLFYVTLFFIKCGLDIVSHDAVCQLLLLMQCLGCSQTTWFCIY